MSREKLKTLILSILFIMSVLLTQQLWFPSPEKIIFSDARNLKIEQSVVSDMRKSMIAPNRITVSFGAGDRKKNYYTMLSSDLDYVWEESEKILSAYFLGEPEIAVTTYERYIQSNVLKSVELEFADKVPSILISSLFDSYENKIVRDIREIKKILIPGFHKGVIYIVGEEDKIFEVKLSNYEQDKTLANFIEKLEKEEFTKYHPIFSLFEEFADNYTPMPINYTVPIAQTYVESKINVNDEIALVERAKGFFNENFDFVKTIKETSGAVVYVYGFGEKGVRISSKGILEYNEEIGPSSSSNIITALDTAIDFMIKRDELPQGIYLKEIKEISHGQNKGYYFGFGYRIGGFPIEFRHGKMANPIEIEVYGGKVKAYRTFVRQIMDIPSIRPDQSVVYFPNIIEKNIESLQLKYLREKGLEQLTEEEKILEILNNIELVQMVYFDGVEEQRIQLLKPAWMIKIKDEVYYFDCYTGELIDNDYPN